MLRFVDTATQRIEPYEEFVAAAQLERVQALLVLLGGEVLAERDREALEVRDRRRAGRGTERQDAEDERRHRRNGKPAVHFSSMPLPGVSGAFSMPGGASAPPSPGGAISSGSPIRGLKR